MKSIIYLLICLTVLSPFAQGSDTISKVKRATLIDKALAAIIRDEALFNVSHHECEETDPLVVVCSLTYAQIICSEQNAGKDKDPSRQRICHRFTCTEIFRHNFKSRETVSLESLGCS